MPNEVQGELKYIFVREKSVKGFIIGKRYINNITGDAITGVLVPEIREDNDIYATELYHYRLMTKQLLIQSVLKVHILIN